MKLDKKRQHSCQGIDLKEYNGYDRNGISCNRLKIFHKAKKKNDDNNNEKATTQ
jgi:hypothetical protein